jgi:hypothetical protein
MKNIFASSTLKAGIVFLFILFSFTVKAAEFLVDPAIGSSKKVSTHQLKRIAVSEGVIPEDVSSSLWKKWQESGESVLIWIISPEKNKVDLISGLQRIHDANEIEIEKDPRYYVNKINVAIFENIKGGNTEEVINKGIIDIFRDIAIMEGYYNEDRPKVEVLRDYLGEEKLDEYKAKYPNKYKEILKDKNNN